LERPMPDYTHAFLKRLACGCAVAVTVEDTDTLHYVRDVYNWQRQKIAAGIERVPLEVAREEIGKTFTRCKDKGWKRGHPGGPCVSGEVVVGT